MANPEKKSNFFVRAVSYVRDSFEELRYKVTWPTKKELSSSAILVLFASIVMSVFIFLVDKAFEFIMTSIYGFLA
ncbi:preprotein translocase subunit SecE [Porphyromonas levii]|uniref:Protein translocase subunit SecE n=1 Tax=Porphyromonas levii TaxID=28114 RepID=A0A4Y8WQT9_9PORP|nr:preprotein translocase subunit SecE [Porphyromonas levii]MBR8702775.1 Protein translocase subunit SecE [Porphyromonas levii]MBR8713617.1 Protein translocase subunit SecE [Porphyromonas levii]MBR8715383.1 Protein translocase subunit SecE [Porphyromonas levii]MBR8727893.1 Protein translocase subunit SecE [Porphyromonas levii]MBR8729933.1 Protein translocase subunit SecE [Porphyromonas levii]